MINRSENKSNLACRIYSYTCIITCVTIYLIVLHSTLSKPPINSPFNDSLWDKSQLLFMFSLFLELLDYIYKGARGVIQDLYFTTILLLLKFSIVFLILNFTGFVSNPLYVLIFICSETFTILVKHLNIVLEFHRKQIPFVEYLDETVSLYSFSTSTFSQLLLVIEALPEMKKNQYFRWFPSPLPNKLNFFIDLYITFIVLILASLVSSIGTYYRKLTCKKSI